MGVYGFSFEMESPIPAATMFQASAVDSHILLPKIMTQLVLGAEIIEGDGGAGSIKHFRFSEVLPFPYVKERVDLLDRENLEYKYTVVEGENIGTKLISTVYHIKFLPSSNGGCVIKANGQYNTNEGVEYTDEEVNGNAGKAGMMGMYKIVEAYLLANPEAYGTKLN